MFLHAKKIITVSALFLLTLSLSDAYAEIIVPPEYKAEVFASGLDHPLSLIFDKEGFLLVTVGGSDKIVKIDHSGKVSDFAFSCVNPLDFSPIYPHSKMTYDLNGNLYVGVVGWYDNRCNGYGDVLDKMYKISPEGDISVAANGTGCCANPFDDISGVAANSHGDIYFADTWTSGAVFIYSPRTGAITKFVSGYGYPRYAMWDILFDKEDNLLIAIPAMSKILKVTPDKTISTVLDGLPVSAIEYNSAGDLYAGNYNSIYKVAPDGTYSLFASGFNGAFDFAFDQEDNLYVVENGANDVIKISINNRPPLANAGSDQAVEMTSCAGASVVLNGTGSSDPDGDALSYAWTENGTVIATGANTTVALSYGIHNITLTVDDGKGGTASDDVTVDVVDTTAPLLSVSLDTNVLWPPNHKYVTVTPSVTVQDACVETTDVELLSASSNEPDNGLGDGDTANDIVVNGNGTLSLRAERSGKGNGRMYTIAYRATDQAGNSTIASSTVAVPHDRGKN